MNQIKEHINDTYTKLITIVISFFIPQASPIFWPKGTSEKIKNIEEKINDLLRTSHSDGNTKYHAFGHNY